MAGIPAPRSFKTERNGFGDVRGYELTRSLFCTLLPFAAGAHAPSAVHPPVRRQSAIGGDFELNDTRGKSFRLSSQRGKVVLIFFGYTDCPGLCPTNLLRLRDVLASLGERRDGVQPVFISVDPGRDTPERLARILPYATPTADVIKAIAPMIELQPADTRR